MKIKRYLATPLHKQDAHMQAQVAVVLLAVVPSLTLFYIGSMQSGGQGGELPVYAKFIAYASTLLVAVAGYRMLRKYPENIVKLRDHIQKMAGGVLSEKVILKQTADSDDLKFIENNLNAILHEMNHRMEVIKDKLETESYLRLEIELQRRTLRQAESHRQMIQNIVTEYQHIGQPTDTLQACLFLIKNHAESDEEVAEIESGIQELDQSYAVFQRLIEINKFRTEPYLSEKSCNESQIMAG